ncbi:hypothetical protein [Cupriavidus sp. UYPR2.512]|uniref:hypothetical protein n=1 Tax=Cupriavidus sp. UYPR2.512 TaxID=1080187 RepID=UPI000371A9FC|nr:hypothetical protein [Cupriavidus sp. UYPR2.512]UIF90862.1 hypothetical protein KAF44_32250 [Cupriavidus necator]
MSYSIGVVAETKEAAKAAIAAKFDADVVAHQPVHARDRAAVLANVDAALSLLADDDSKDVSVSVNGYVSWQTPEPQDVVPLTSVGITAGVGYVARKAVE